MKTILSLSLAGCVIATPAFAQDEDWSGPYVGVSAGYTSTKSNSDVALSGDWANEPQALQDFFVNSFATSQSYDDANYGAQVGYNYQSGEAVFGLEAEIAGIGGKDVVARGPFDYVPTAGLNYSFTNTIDPDYMIALKGKLGFATGNTLFYAEGGWAWTRAKLGAEITGSNGYLKSGAIKKTLDGFIVGGGIEHRFGSNVSARISYDYTDQGDVSYGTVYDPISTFAPPAYTYGETVRQDLRMHLVRIGLNYHF